MVSSIWKLCCEVCLNISLKSNMRTKYQCCSFAYVLVILKNCDKVLQSFVFISFEPATTVEYIEVFLSIQRISLAFHIHWIFWANHLYTKFKKKYCKQEAIQPQQITNKTNQPQSSGRWRIWRTGKITSALWRTTQK